MNPRRLLVLACCLCLSGCGDDVTIAIDSSSSDAAGQPDLIAAPDVIDAAADAGADIRDAASTETAGDAGSPDVAPPSDAPADDVDVPDTVMADASDADAGADAAFDIEPEQDTAPPVFAEVCDLLANAGAETGDLTGWSVIEGAFAAVQQDSGQVPAPVDGSWLFFAGQAAVSVASQDVDLSPHAAFIDAGGLWLQLDASVRDWSGRDGAGLSVQALDAAGEIVATAAAGPYFRDSWTERRAALRVPPGTRTARVTMRGEREAGTDNDAFFDALEVCLTDAEPAALASDLTAPPYLMNTSPDGVSVLFETEAPTRGEVRWGDQVLVDDTPRRLHEFRITGAAAAATQSYVVAWEGGALPARSFVTAPAPGAATATTFVVWGDNQDGPEVFLDIAAEMAAVAPDFGVNVGDCVQNGTRDEYREQLFEPLAGVADQMPFLVGAGNHERYQDPGAELFEEYMAQPGDEHCFGWQWGGVYIMFIDTELGVDPGDPQRACIDAALGSPEAVAASWRMAAFHKPPRIEFWFGGFLAFFGSLRGDFVRETLEPLLESHNVDLVFSGHNHLYAYTPETPGGITWVTTGGGGGRIDSGAAIWRVGTWPEISVTIHEHHFLVVDADDATLTVTAVDELGATLHSFTVSNAEPSE